MRGIEKLKVKQTGHVVNNLLETGNIWDRWWFPFQQLNDDISVSHLSLLIAP
jgi:hypothetical protein